MRAAAIIRVGELLPSLGHFSQNFSLLLGLGVSSEAMAFFRKFPVVP
jgi:hypothetical protein